MSSLRQAVEDYLRIRRALGHKLANAGRLLPQFADYLESVGAETITTEYALRWATMPSGANPVYWQLRLSVARGFARYLLTIDPAAEVPPSGLLPGAAGGRRPTPYVYFDDEIAALMAAAGRWRRWRSRLGAQTLQTLIGLLAVTGMRIGRRSALIAASSTLSTSAWSCITASSGNPGSFRCTRARSTRCAITWTCAIRCTRTSRRRRY
jgi:integrase/recombinase XerD